MLLYFFYFVSFYNCFFISSSKITKKSSICSFEICPKIPILIRLSAYFPFPPVTVYPFSSSAAITDFIIIPSLYTEIKVFVLFSSFFTNSSNPNFCAFSSRSRSEECRVGKECRSRWSPYH